jgi:hypothetical protein
MKTHNMLSEAWLAQYQDHQKNAMNALGECTQELSFSDGVLQEHMIGSWFMVRVTAGTLQLQLDNQELLVLEPGDCWLAQPRKPLAWGQQGAVTIDVWECDTQAKTTLLDIVHGFYDLTLMLLNAFRRPVVDPTANYKTFEDGAVIVAEGALGEAVFVLVQGNAIVKRNKKKIGTVKQNEIIGLHAMLLKQKRAASVIADGPCCVAQIPYDNFRQLIEAKPELVMATLESLAQQLERTNQLLTQNQWSVVGF